MSLDQENKTPQVLNNAEFAAKLSSTARQSEPSSQEVVHRNTLPCKVRMMQSPGSVSLTELMHTPAHEQNQKTKSGGTSEPQKRITTSLPRSLLLTSNAAAGRLDAIKQNGDQSSRVMTYQEKSRLLLYSTSLQMSD